jgi:hypothetical protein
LDVLSTVCAKEGAEKVFAGGILGKTGMFVGVLRLGLLPLEPPLELEFVLLKLAALLIIQKVGTSARCALKCPFQAEDKTKTAEHRSYQKEPRKFDSMFDDHSRQTGGTSKERFTQLD